MSQNVRKDKNSEPKTAHSLEMRLIREISIQAEVFYEDAVKLGDHAAYAFRDPSRSKRNSHRAQLTGLENIAESSLKTSDIFDYIKKQVARFEHWQKPYSGSTSPELGFGEALKNYLETDIAKKRDRICIRLGIAASTDDDRYQRQQIYLQLIRQFIRHVVVQYEYRISVDERSANGSNARANA